MAAIDLTTVASVKQYLGIKNTDTTADTLLTWLVTAVSKWILTQLGRDIQQTTYTEVVNGDDTQSLTLANQPVVSVLDPGGVVVNGDVIPKRVTTLPGDTGWVLLNGRLLLVGYYFVWGFGNCQITYTAGYATVPEDLAQATIHMVGEVYRGRDRHGLSSRTVPQGETLTFRPDAIPFFISYVIDSYKRVLGVAP